MLSAFQVDLGKHRTDQKHIMNDNMNASRSPGIHAIEKRGDLLASPCDAIVQQCNCVTMMSHGLSATIADRFPYADVYAKRQAKSRNTATKSTRGVPGDLVLCKPPQPVAGPAVVCLMSQICPGRPGQWAERYGVEAASDDESSRLTFFKSSLEKLESLAVEEKWNSLGFPAHIGCGLAGGNWVDYKRAIEQLARNLKRSNTSVFIYKL